MEGSSPTCGEEINVAPGGKTKIPAGGNRRFSIENWETVDLAMGGIKIYGYVIAMLESEGGNMFVDHDESCIYKCNEALVSHNFAGDGDMPTSFEVKDSNGLRSPVEIALRTDPVVSDTDKDGALDGMEAVAGTNLLNLEDKPESVAMEDFNGAGGIDEVVPTTLPSKMPISALPTAIPTINPRSLSPTHAPDEFVNAFAEDEPCQVLVRRLLHHENKWHHE